MNDQSMHLIRAIRGPVFLITVGVLFAFDKFTEFRFSQTWPILLIVMGLLSLGGGRRYRLRERDGLNGNPVNGPAEVPPQEGTRP
jgi:hypothetical protein